VYKIGELAVAANVSKRTIDYYTNLGLLHAQRSASNYRYYSEESLEDLKFIENCKQLHIPLDEIKQKLLLRKTTHIEKDELQKQTEQIAKRVEQLNKELCGILPIFNQLDEAEKRTISTHLSDEGKRLIQSLQGLIV